MAVARPVGAQTGMWKSTDGPWGAVEVGAVATDVDGVLQIGTPGGVFRRQPDASWTADSDGLFGAGRNVRAFLKLPNGALLLGSFGDGIYRREPRGGWWFHMDAPRAYVHVLAGGGSASLFAGTAAGILRSRDGGDTWTRLPVSGQLMPVYGLAVSGDTVHVGTPDGIYRSFDDADTFEPVFLGLSDLNVTTLYRSRSGTLFAGLAPLFGGCPLYRSRSEGNLWVCVDGGANLFRVDSFAEDDAGRVFVGSYRRILRSDNEGNSWSNASASRATVQALAIADGLVAAGTDGAGIWISSDRGSTFEAANDGLPSSIRDILSDPDGNVTVATAGGIYRAGSSLSGWELLDDPVAPLRAPRSLLADPGGFLAGTDGGVYRYSEHAREWTLLGPPGSPPINDLARASDGDIIAGWHEGVYRLGGTTWTPYAIAGSDQAPRNIIAVGAAANGRVFAGGSYDSFRNDPGQLWWEPLVGDSAPYFESSVFAASPDGQYYAGTQYFGVMVSDDGGIQWKRDAGGLDGREDVRAIAFDQQERPWIGTFGTGVFRQHISTRTWIPESDGLGSSLQITALTTQGPDRLLVGTFAGGLFERTLSGGTGAESVSSALPSLRSDSPWPNPSRGDDIRFKIETDLPGVLVVEYVDALGRRVSAPMRMRAEQPGTIRVTLPTADLAPGLYLVRISRHAASGAEAVTHTVLITRG